MASFHLLYISEEAFFFFLSFCTIASVNIADVPSTILEICTDMRECTHAHARTHTSVVTLFLCSIYDFVFLLLFYFFLSRLLAIVLLGFSRFRCYNSAWAPLLLNFSCLHWWCPTYCSEDINIFWSLRFIFDSTDLFFSITWSLSPSLFFTTSILSTKSFLVDCIK